MTAIPTTASRSLETAIKEGNQDKLDMFLELLIELKISNLHAAELGDTAFDQGDVELEVG